MRNAFQWPSLAAMALAAACSSSGGDAGRELSGSVSVSLQQVPTDVGCVRIQGVGASRTASHDFDVKPGAGTVLTMGGVPIGDVTFYGSAFSSACAGVGAGAQPNWSGDPATAKIVAGRTTGLLLVLSQNGTVRIGIDFKTDPVTGAPCVSSDPGCLDPKDAFGAAKDPLPDGARVVSGPEFVAMLNDGTLDLGSLDLESRAKAAHDAKYKADRALVEEALKDQPDLLRRMESEPTEDDTLKMAGDGNYFLTITDETGANRNVMTMGSDFRFGAAASALRRYHTHDNQAAIYEQLYAQLPADYVKRSNLLSPDRVRALEAGLIEQQNLTITKDLASILGLIQIPEIQPPKCSDEEGTPAHPGNESGSCKPAGLFAKKSFPLRPYTTCVKDQANRGSCVAFGITGAVESALAVKYGRYVNLSEQRLYYWEKVPTSYGDGLDTFGTMTDMINKGFKYPWEYQWDYNPSWSRMDWKPAPFYTNSCVGYSGLHCSDTAHQGDLVCTTVFNQSFCGWNGQAPGSSGFKLAGALELMPFGGGSAALGVPLARLFLTLKTPVVISFDVTTTFDHAGSNGIASYVGPFEGNRGSHATELVGFIDNDKLPSGTPEGAGGGYFIVKNSWGSCWKDGGYVYLPYAWVDAYALSMVAAWSN